MTGYLKGAIYLLVAIVPLSIGGYFLAVNAEDLFIFYEWLLVAVVLTAFILSVKTVCENQGAGKWLAGSVVAFILQFTVLSLFLGPFTYYSMIFVYYGVAFLAFIVYVKALKKNRVHRAIPIILLVFTSVFTVYMFLLNSLWGVNWS
ncbi:MULTISPECIES: hypothetical protein [Pontibacillus]|uniref:Uncharacterized protein n=1 Tax=Pontibacillus chungwhensis TaxID=265426 RepID=A0ABY8UT99_9BACI|nr:MULTISPECIES: hypothetical protein [Pontibacillus]MCD5323265.1 hypothetical protein [Pontibacillus sp. HN14]WIF96648.1 hypothetical protein QNI29_12910 [Pontibacillus chungwhensis]